MMQNSLNFESQESNENSNEINGVEVKEYYTYVVDAVDVEL